MILRFDQAANNKRFDDDTDDDDNDDDDDDEKNVAPLSIQGFVEAVVSAWRTRRRRYTKKRRRKLCQMIIFCVLSMTMTIRPPRSSQTAIQLHHDYQP